MVAALSSPLLSRTCASHRQGPGSWGLSSMLRGLLTWRGMCRFDRAFDGVGLRIANGADIIPHLPPRFLEYADCGREVYLTTFGAVIMDPKARAPCTTST